MVSATVTQLETSSPVGRLLKHWRGVRRMSQLDLALAAEISARHLSFVETGRAQPSREMVLRLATALDVPLRERNALLHAAGYAPSYPESGLEAPELAQARKALQFMLDAHEPFGAIVTDRRWNVVMANQGAMRLMAFLLPWLATDPPETINVKRLLFAENGLKNYLTNWEQLAEHQLRSLQREVAAGNDPELADLLQEIQAYPGVPKHLLVPDFSMPSVPLLSLNVRKDDVELNLFTMISTFGTPQDVTLQELRIESFFPTDEATEAAWRKLGEGG